MSLETWQDDGSHSTSEQTKTIDGFILRTRQTEDGPITKRNTRIWTRLYYDSLDRSSLLRLKRLLRNGNGLEDVHDHGSVELWGGAGYWFGMVSIWGRVRVVVRGKKLDEVLFWFLLKREALR